MDSFRKTALVTGILYLITFLSSIPAALLLGAAQVDPTFTFAGITDGQIRLAAVLELVNALACFGTAVAVFSVIRREHEGLALGFVTTRMFEAATLVVGIIALLTVATLREAGTAADDAVPALAAIRFWSVLIGPGMASFNALMFATLLFRARLVPRAVPALGLVGAPLFIAFLATTMLGLTDPGTPLQAIAVAPFFIWELVVGLWMTFKGFSRSSRIAADDLAAPSLSATAKAGVA